VPAIARSWCSSFASRAVGGDALLRLGPNVARADRVTLVDQVHRDARSHVAYADDAYLHDAPSSIVC
jgi:hypothetical protein